MCGITGEIRFDGRSVDGRVLDRMTDSLAHRGPDGRGVFRDGPVGLGHRRLAVIDLSPSAAQPMSSPDGRFVIVYNGEVYNFRELRAELEAEGVSFRTGSDTEVVLQLYIRDREAALDRFNGMFALAVWDRVERSLFLARDRYGIKPLYYARVGSSFLFGSETKAFLSHPDFSPEVDPEALLEYFTFQNLFTPRNLLKGVRILPAGSRLRVSPDDSAPVEPRSYWDFEFREAQASADPRELEEELDRLFTQAVTRQLVSDVEVGAYLSGGMDSGSITSVAARSLPYIKTFTCGFDLHSASGLELSFDEREAAEYMSYVFRTEHYEMVLKAGDMERCFPELAWHIEEPRVGQSYPNFYVARLAGKFVKVCLSGAGGDELFGGYPWRYYRTLESDGFEDYIDKYYGFWQRLVPNRFLKPMFRPLRDRVAGVWTRDIFRDVFRKHANELKRPEDYVNHSLYFEAKTFLHGLLVVDDKLSMAHGLETRVPFLDNDLVDFATRVPVGLKLKELAKVEPRDENLPGHKVNEYFLRTRDGKQLLRGAMARHLPREILEAKKVGFTPPGGSWFKGDSLEYVRRMLLGKKAAIYDYLDYKTVTDLITEHLDGRENRRLMIWSLLSFEWWLKKFVNGAGRG